MIGIKATWKSARSNGVEITEIEALFQQEVAVFPDVSHSKDEDRHIGIGKTEQGRHVFIAFTLRTVGNDVLIRPISARYMHLKEVKHYEKAIAQPKNR